MTSGRDLPAVAPLFPLAGAIMLPHAALPLNIFEPRYLAMVQDAMAGDRVIGIVQPRDGGEGEQPPLHAVGGLGRITEFAETADGRILLVLTGQGRFRIAEELAVDTPYRQARLDYGDFAGDLAESAPIAPEVRERVETTLKTFLDAQGLSADWDAVKQADDDALVRTLASVCPFEPIEKQALLEAPGLAERADMLVALMAFAPAGAETASGRVQ